MYNNVYHFDKIAIKRLKICNHLSKHIIVLLGEQKTLNLLTKLLHTGRGWRTKTHLFRGIACNEGAPFLAHLATSLYEIQNTNTLYTHNNL